MERNDAKASTIRDYLVSLLAVVWDEDEGFSGKRPFGNSGWQTDLYLALIRGGALEGTVDEDGYPDEYDYRASDRVIASAIEALRAEAPVPAPTPEAFDLHDVEAMQQLVNHAAHALAERILHLERELAGTEEALRQARAAKAEADEC